MFEVKESFEWMTPEFKLVDLGKDTVKIKGIALRGGEVTRNNRRYVEEELYAAARTFIHKPITINHNMNKKVGHIEWMEWNPKENALEYLATIKKQPYVDMIRDKSTHIKGVSIEAMYLKNRCHVCGEEFDDNQLLYSHLQDSHYIRNFTSQPRGMIGTALSLVLTPEEPGYPGTSIELMEMYGRGLQLLEMVIKDSKRKEEYMNKTKGKAVLEKRSSITPDIAREELEVEKDEDKAGTKQPPTSTPAPDAPVDEDLAGTDSQSENDSPPEAPAAVEQQEPDEEEAEKIEEQEISCPDGYHREGEECVLDAPPEAEEQVDHSKLAPPTQPEAPVADVPVDEDLASTDEEESTTTVDLPELKVDEVKLPAKLRLGEPFASYSSVDDCIAKNPDKPDPAAYCASIMRKVEGEPAAEVKETQNIYETQQNLTKSLKEIRDSSYVRSARQAKTVNGLIESSAKTLRKLGEVNKPLKVLGSALATESKARAKADKRLLTEASKRVKAAVDQTTQLAAETRQQIAETAKNLQTSIKNEQVRVNKEFGKLATEIAKVPRKDSRLPKLKEAVDRLTHKIEQDTQLTDLKETVDELTKKIADHELTIATFEKQVKEQKEDFDKVLATADNLAKERDARIKELEDEKQKREEDEEDEEKKDTAEIKETLKTLKENWEHYMQKGGFMGANPNKSQNSEPRTSGNPLAEKEK